MIQRMDLVRKLHQTFVVNKIMGDEYESGPLVVEWDPTEVCNLACPGCISEDLVCNSTSFSRERLLEIASELKDLGVKAVVLIGGGEPLAHPAVGELIEYLGNNDINIGITTNGYFIPRYLDTIAKYVSWTRVSMDAATPETFNKLRPAKDGKNKFEAIVNAMKALAKVKTGTLGFSYLIRTEADGFGIKSNIDEIYEAAVLAKEIGCDYFEVKPSYSYVDGQDHALVIHSKERMEEAKKQIEKIKEVGTDGFRVVTAINLEDSLNCVETKQIKKYTDCPSAHLRTLICPSGVFVCPYWRGKEPFKIGDAMTESMKNIWFGDRRKQVMRGLDPCKVCGFHCLRNETNIEIAEMRNGKKVDIIEEYDRFI